VVDLSDGDQVRGAVEGADSILHAAEFDPAAASALIDEKTLFQRASLGTYRLCAAARDAGVPRIVLVGTLAVFDSYPDDYLIDEMWEPKPSSEPAGLTPYIPELVAREFAREGGIGIVCLRFGGIGDGPDGTRAGDAFEAIERAFDFSFGDKGYRWRVFHVSSSPRFILRNAHRDLGFGQGKGA
jgi:nucleoside-diphosphate-sugar epimerase